MQEYASATCSFSILQILPCKNLHLQLAFSLFCRYSTPKKFIRNFLFRYLADTPLQKFASASCFFSILQILPTQKVHPQLAFSLSCRYSPHKKCIHNLLFLYLADTPHSNTLFYLIYSGFLLDFYFDF